MVARLEGIARRHVPAGFEGWKEDAARNAMTTRFRYADFNQAFAFVNESALEAERMDRHPQACNRMSVLLSVRERLSQRGGARFAGRLAT